MKKAADAASSDGSGLREAAPHYHGHRQRLRDRFMEAGEAALTDYSSGAAVVSRDRARREAACEGLDRACPSPRLSRRGRKAS
jgi:DNA repair protein RadC